MIYAFRATMKRDGAKLAKFDEKLVDPKLGGNNGIIMGGTRIVERICWPISFWAN
jgi:hypothetical protein